MADAAPAPGWVTSAEGGMEFVNQAFVDITGLPREAITGDVWLSLLHPEDLPEIGRQRLEARKTLAPYGFEARFRDADGGWRWMKASARPRFTDDNVFDGYVGLAIDITDIKRAQQEQQLLINELNHRVKNTLATVQSIARQTLGATCPRPLLDDFTDRLIALSDAHDVLTCRSWSSASVEDLIAAAVRPYQSTGITRFTLAGPAAWLSPRAALGLSMALHELATNAVKYGSLSCAEGRVSLTWTRQTGPDGDRLHLTWAESNGPPVHAPSHRGFGSRLLEKGLASDLGAAARLTFDPAGLVARIEAPLIDPPT